MLHQGIRLKPTHATAGLQLRQRPVTSEHGLASSINAQLARNFSSTGLRPTLQEPLAVTTQARSNWAIRKKIDQQRNAAKQAQISKPEAKPKKSSNNSLDAVLVGAGLLVVITVAVNAASKLNPSQITAL